MCDIFLVIIAQVVNLNLYGVGYMTLKGLRAQEGVQFPVNTMSLIGET